MIALLSNVLFIVGTVLPIIVLQFDILRRVRAGQPWFTRFTVKLAVVAMLSVALQCLAKISMAHPELPALRALVSSVFALLVGAAVLLFYDAVKRPENSAESSEETLRKAWPLLSACHLHETVLAEDDFLKGQMADEEVSPFETQPIIEVTKEIIDES